MRAREPIFNVPAAVTGAIAVLVLVQLVLSWQGETTEDHVKALLAFQPRRYGFPPPKFVDDLPGAAIWSFVSHQLVHGDWTHLAMNSVWLLAFGGAVASRIGNLRFVLLGLASGICGAAVYLAIRWGDPVPMVGASGAVSGLMGGAFRFFFNHTRLQELGIPVHDPASVPRMSLLETFTDRRVLTMIAIWAAINIAVAASSFLLTSGAGIAWEAHLGGFMFGILFFGLFDRRSPPTVAYEHGDERPTLH